MPYNTIKDIFTEKTDIQDSINELWASSGVQEKYPIDLGLYATSKIRKTKKQANTQSVYEINSRNRIECIYRVEMSDVDYKEIVKYTSLMIAMCESEAHKTAISRLENDSAIITYNHYENKIRCTGSNYAYGHIVSPRTSLKFDVTYKDEDKTLDIAVKLTIKQIQL